MADTRPAVNARLGVLTGDGDFARALWGSQQRHWGEAFRKPRPQSGAAFEQLDQAQPLAGQALAIGTPNSAQPTNAVHPTASPPARA